MQVDQTISFGDIMVCVGIVAAGAANYFGTIAKINSVDYKVEELRRGRGLILKDWPYTIQRCFNYVYVARNGKHTDDS